MNLLSKKRIAVLHALVPFVSGGAELHVKGLRDALVRRGYEAEVVSLPFKWYPRKSLEDSYLMWRMLDLTACEAGPIDLAIALKVPTFMVKHPNKAVWVMHQFRQAYDWRDDPAKGGLDLTEEGRQIIAEVTRMDNLGIGEARAVYANSRNVAARLQKYNGIASAPLYHPPSLVGRYRIGEYGDYILSVGRLDAAKRIDLLIRALPYCDSHIRVKIAGRGPEMTALQKLAVELGVADRVDLLGFVPDDDLLDLYANALAVCYPPLDEDYGYVTLEAFLSQKPVLTCHDSGGVLEFAREGENAFITDFDAAQMGAAFDKVYANKAMARDMGASGYGLVKDISWDNVVDELTKTIR